MPLCPGGRRPIGNRSRTVRWRAALSNLDTRSDLTSPDIATDSDPDEGTVEWSAKGGNRTLRFGPDADAQPGIADGQDPLKVLAMVRTVSAMTQVSGEPVALVRAVQKPDHGS